MLALLSWSLILLISRQDKSMSLSCIIFCCGNTEEINQENKSNFSRQLLKDSTYQAFKSTWKIIQSNRYHSDTLNCHKPAQEEKTVSIFFIRTLVSDLSITTSEIQCRKLRRTAYGIHLSFLRSA